MKLKLLITAAMLLLLLFLTMGSFIGFKIIQKKIRTEIKYRIKSGIKEKDLITFQFTDAALKGISWIKENEFSYKGHLYDVVSTSSIRDLTTLRVISDFQEEELFKNLDQMMSNELSEKKGSEPLKTMGQFLSKKYLKDGFLKLKINFVNLSSMVFYYPSVLTEPVLTATTPPPRKA